MTGKKGIVILCATLALMAACDRAPRDVPEKPVEPAPARQTLLASPAGETSQQLEVGLGACDATGCPIEVRLVEGGQIRDTKRLEWPAPAGSTPQPAQPDPLFVGDVPAWILGEGEDGVVMAARPVKLDAQRTGVLVDQLVGYEHLKRRHELFGVVDGRIVSLWSAKDGEGPYWSAVVIQPDGHSDRPVLLTSFDPDPAQASTVTASALVWDAASGQLHADPVPVTVGATVFDVFSTVAAARSAKEAQPDCLAAFWVLDAQQIGLEAKKRYVLAALGPDAKAAEQVAQRAAQCAPADSSSPPSATAVKLPGGA